MAFLSEIFSDSISEAIKCNRKSVYKKIFLCYTDASLTKVPILKETVSVTLAILNTVTKIKMNSDAFQALAHRAADLIVGIWQSYKKAKFPGKWLSPPLKGVLGELLGNLKSMLVFFKRQASTNIVLRMISGSIDMRRIDRYHQRLTIALDKFEIQSHILNDRLMLQILDKQKKLSNQIQRRNGIKNIRVEGKKAKKGPSVRTSITSVSPTVHAEDLPTSDGVRTRKNSVRNISPRQAGKHTLKRTWKMDAVSEDKDGSDWREDEALPLLAPLNKTRSPMHNNSTPPTSVPYDWPCRADESATTSLNWTLPSCRNPAITFSSSGMVLETAHSNVLNIGNLPYYHYYR